MKDVYKFYLKTNFLATRKEITSPHCTVLCEYHNKYKSSSYSSYVYQIFRTLCLMWTFKIVFLLLRVNGHDVAAELLVKTVGPQVVNVSDAKGR